MITSELIMEKVNNYSNKDIVDKVESVIGGNDFNFKMMHYERERHVFNLKIHDMYTTKGGAEKFGFSETIDHLERINDKNILICVYRENSYMVHFLFQEEPMTLISIMGLKIRVKSQEEIDEIMAMVNRN
ncbi:Uncharacterised protein [Serratia fonticola]|jgi:hypothetical protein|uniref:hypothetical protein n=1 Tax=Serratia fonticola TaxID=47917 RepID=UPI000FBA8F40|nr:hypothetical protein [Serratia fonticola]MBL5904621.1 hypothetical protein [Serratia fonticola]CAI1728992.1 Uncharacterised protein [Serratia fonticola]